MLHSTNKNDLQKLSEKSASCMSSSTQTQSLNRAFQDIADKYFSDPVYSKTYVKSKDRAHDIIEDIIGQVKSSVHASESKLPFRSEDYQLNIPVKSRELPDGKWEYGHPRLHIVRDIRSSAIMSYSITLDK